MQPGLGPVKKRVLGERYLLEKRIGEGGMGVVYRAVDQVTGQVVAVKIIREHIACESRAVKRFLREARAARRLSHPNIVRILDDGTDIEHYLVMEYVEGVTVREWVRTYGRAHGPLVAMLGEVLAALHHAHSRGIIHRDIKPENIIVTPHRHIKLMDFGLARSMEGPGDTVTQTGAIVGTVAYMSPEQASGKRGDERSDLYSLGIVAYELLTGKRPFTGESPMAILVKHIQDEPVPPSRHNPSIPPLLERVVLRLMAKRPDERYASAVATWEDLRLCQERPLRSHRTAPAPPPVSAAAAGYRVPPTVADVLQQHADAEPETLERREEPMRPVRQASWPLRPATAARTAPAPVTGGAVGVPAGPGPATHPAMMRRAAIRYPIERRAPARVPSPPVEIQKVEVAILHTRVQAMQEILDERSALDALEIVGQYERTVESIAAHFRGRVLCRSGPTQVLVFDGNVVSNPAESAVGALVSLKHEVIALASDLSGMHVAAGELFLSAGIYMASLPVPGEGSLDDSIGEELLNGARRMHDYSANERKYCMLCDLTCERVGHRVPLTPFCSTFIAGRKSKVQVYEVVETAG